MQLSALPLDHAFLLTLKVVHRRPFYKREEKGYRIEERGIGVMMGTDKRRDKRGEGEEERGE